MRDGVEYGFDRPRINIFSNAIFPKTLSRNLVALPMEDHRGGHLSSVADWHACDFERQVARDRLG